MVILGFTLIPMYANIIFANLLVAIAIRSGSPCSWLGRR